MPVNLNQPLRWKQANADEQAMLADLQANILKGHGREDTKNLFLHFDNKADGRKCLKKAAAHVLSAAKQLQDIEKFKKAHKSGKPFVGVLLTTAGYAALEIDAAQIPPDTAFRQGMKPRSPALNDPPVERWESTFGSYFVFRKLEQNVKGFKDAEEQLAKELGLNGDAAERAGALVVGRFEDGTPVVLQKAEGFHNPVPNNFTYKDDPAGQKCPFHGHIRKTNPRGESVGTFAATEEEERAHLILRPGVTYGKRKKDMTDRPSKDVGLLFMCFQSSIENQFEFMQSSWANNPNFAKPGEGIDPVIEQGHGPKQSWPTQWGEPGKQKQAFEGFVTMKGGEYFFAPCISFLKNL